jgi:hypothetical protein
MQLTLEKRWLVAFCLVLQNTVGTVARLIYFDPPDPGAGRRLVDSSDTTVANLLPVPEAKEESPQREERNLPIDRSLERAKVDHLYVDFVNCKFEHNTYGTEGPSVIEVATAQVRARIKNCVFYKNDYETGADVSTVFSLLE